jgi:hypothetical protein
LDRLEPKGQPSIMAARIGIELGPVACRIVEVEGAVSSDWRGATTRVRSFGCHVRPSDDMREALAALRGRAAAVVAWGLSAQHTQQTVHKGPYERMRLEALAHLGATSRPAAARLLADIAPAARPEPSASTRPVVVISARAAEVAAALRPIRFAGIRLESVITPAAALLALARSRRHSPGAFEAYVGLAETQVAIVFAQDGHLVSALELPWGYLDPDRALLVRPKAQIAARLAGQLESCVDAYRSAHGPVSTVYVSSGMPDLRSMTAALIDCLDVEIEPLDSFFGIDTDHLPEDGVDLRDRAAELRLAWIAAAHQPAPFNLLREHRHRERRAWFSRAAVAAGMVAGLGLGYTVEASGWGVAAAPPSFVRPPARSDALSTAVARTGPTGPRHGGSASTLDRDVSAPLLKRSYEPPPDVVFEGRGEPAGPPRTPGAADAPQPFAAALKTILYSPERSLAIIDGRIVQPGDDVRGARVVAISPTAVVVRDRDGREARLQVGQGAGEQP